MTDSEKPGMFDSILSKGEDALDKFMDDPEKVAKARQKADSLLAKHVGQDQADSITGTAEDALRKFSDRNDPQ